MKISNKTVQKLLDTYKEIAILGKVEALLDWDMNVNLPTKATEGRAEQAGLLTKIVSQKWLDPNFKTLFEKAKEEKGLSKEEKAILRNLEKSARFYFKVPQEIIIERQKTMSEAFMAWQTAKKQNKFADFLPHLKKLISLHHIIAQHLGYNKNPYDALLDLHEQQLTADYTKKMFDTITPELIKLIKRIQNSKTLKNHSEYIDGTFFYPHEAQRQILLYIMKKMNYDLEAGRMDVSAHPFTTTLDKHDIRITTMYKDHDFRDSFTSTMHETGHALYEQGINADYANTPLEGGVSYGIHEALSRFWENQIGRSPQFLSYMTPLFQAFYPEQLGKASEETIIRLFNDVHPSFIRIEADEVTYSLHIILRFTIENDLFNNKIKPKDLPEAWRAKSKEFFGIEPQSDREGVLQDVHWAFGSFGYFPAYALGNLYASQFLATMNKELNVNKTLKKGELGTILYWLNENIHQYGSLYWPKELVKKVTGEELNPQYFIDYLNKKYKVIYHLNGN